MRNLHYKAFCFRLSEKTIGELKQMRKDYGSFNLLFADLIKKFHKTNLNKKNNPKK
jgi:uncharacterized protein with NRDE domain